MRMVDNVGLELERSEFQLEPGDPPLSTSLLVRNNSAVIDEFRLYVDGLDPGSAYLDPDVVRLFPGGESLVTLTLRASGTALAGTYRFRVAVTSSRDSTMASSLNATLQVATIGAVELEAIPSRLRARRSATGRLHVRNRRNAHAPVRLRASDPDARLRFEMAPSELVLAPGSERVVRLRVDLPRVPLTGSTREHQFSIVLLAADDVLSPPLAGVMAQVVQLPLLAWLAGLTALLGRWLFMMLVLALMAVVGIWYLGAPGEPSPPSAARQTAAQAATESLATNEAGPDSTLGEPVPAAPPEAPGGALALAASRASSPTGSTNASQASGALAAANPAAKPATVAVTPTPQTPEIVRFGLAAPSGEPSPAVPLQWTVRNASSLSLEQDSPGHDSSTVYDAIERRDYTLRAANDAGEHAQSLSVYIVRPPAIEQFSTDRTEIVAGESVYMHWRTARALRVFLDDSPLEAIEAGSLLLQPTESHTYTLRAENGAGEVTESLTVTVSPPPTLTPTATPRPRR